MQEKAGQAADDKLGEVTLLLHRVEAGDPRAADEILPLVYESLRDLASAKLAHEAPGQTLQPTALVHEAWLRLGGDRQPSWQNRAHFFGAAAEAMRRILVDNARRRQTVRHGGGLQRAEAEDAADRVAAPESDAETLLLHDALSALEKHDPRKAELVKHRFFTGLELAEAAEVMGISERTANRDWIYARAWLFNEIKRLRN